MISFYVFGLPLYLIPCHYFVQCVVSCLVDALSVEELQRTRASRLLKKKNDLPTSMTEALSHCLTAPPRPWPSASHPISTRRTARERLCRHTQAPVGCYPSRTPAPRTCPGRTAGT